MNSTRLDEKTLKEFLECVMSGQRGDIKGFVGYDSPDKLIGNAYPMADRCLDFVESMKDKTDSCFKLVLSAAMAEAYDQGYKRGLRDEAKHNDEEKSLTAQDIKKACDKGYEDGKKDGIQEGIDMCTAAIQFLNNTDESTMRYIFRIDSDIEYPFDYILETWSMDYIVDCIEEYTKQHKVKPVKTKDISKAYDTGYADGLKEGEKLGIEECDNVIIYMSKNFKTGDYINMFGYTRLDYVLEEYSMSDIIDKVAHYITINETPEAQFNKLVKDIALKFNVPVETAKNIIKEYTSKDDDTKSTE